MTVAMVRTSVPELRRMAPDALRMAGLPIGQADECADMLVWSEVVTGGALRFLRLHRARMLWSPRPAPALTSAADGVLVDAQGASLLELGVRFIDFGRSEAATRSTAVVTICNTYGSIFLPYLCSRSSRYGYQADATATRPGTDTELTPGPGERRADVRLVLTRLESPHPTADIGDSSTAPQRWRTALNEGLDVDADDFAAFTHQFEMLRVPTSERSRTHAG